MGSWAKKRLTGSERIGFIRATFYTWRQSVLTATIARLFLFPYREWFIKLFTVGGDIVIDPFKGSGTTAMACLNLQRHFIGIELQDKYYNLCLQSIQKRQSSLPLVHDKVSANS